jgi:hypothetical protein
MVTNVNMLEHSEAPEFISGCQWGLYWSCHPISRLHIFSSVFRCPVRFMRENVRFVITLICVVEGSWFIYYLCLFTPWCSRRLTVAQRVPLVEHKLRNSARGLLVAEGVIDPVFSVSALTWFIIYIYIFILELYSSYVFMFKTKVLHS